MQFDRNDNGNTGLPDDRAIYEIRNSKMRQREDLKLAVPELDGATDFTLTFKLEKFNTNSVTPHFFLAFPVKGFGRFTADYYLGPGRTGNSANFSLLMPEHGRIAGVGKPRVSSNFGKQTTIIQVRRNRIRVFLSGWKIVDREIPEVKETTDGADLSLLLGVNSGGSGGTVRFRLHQLELQIP